MGVKFIEWFLDDFIPTFFNTAVESIKMALGIVLIIITLPMWFLPFLYWYFCKYFDN